MPDPGSPTVTPSRAKPGTSAKSRERSALRSTAPRPIAPARNGSSTDPQPPPTRVLIVDDQKLVADTVGQVLKTSGFHPCVAYDARSALELAPTFRPDLLLTDVLMPNMDGVELAISFRNLYPGTRILLFSGQVGLSALLEQAAERGHHFELIPKPIHPSLLIERLRQA